MIMCLQLLIDTDLSLEILNSVTQLIELQSCFSFKRQSRVRTDNQFPKLFVDFAVVCRKVLCFESANKVGLYHAKLLRFDAAFMGNNMISRKPNSPVYSANEKR